MWGIIIIQKYKIDKQISNLYHYFYIIILSFWSHFWSHFPHGPVMLGFKREKKDEDDSLFEVSEKIDKRLTAGTPNRNFSRAASL